MNKRHFTCDCCGAYFTDYLENQVKHDKDKGYGLCPSCVEWINAKNEKEWIKLEGKVAASLNPTNREKFLSYELGVRRGLILGMIEEGVISYSIASK